MTDDEYNLRRGHCERVVNRDLWPAFLRRRAIRRKRWFQYDHIWPDTTLYGPNWGIKTTPAEWDELEAQRLAREQQAALAKAPPAKFVTSGFYIPPGQLSPPSTAMTYPDPFPGSAMGPEPVLPGSPPFIGWRIWNIRSIPEALLGAMANDYAWEGPVLHIPEADILGLGFQGTGYHSFKAREDIRSCYRIDQSHVIGQVQHFDVVCEYARGYRSSAAIVRSLEVDPVFDENFRKALADRYQCEVIVREPSTLRRAEFYGASGPMTYARAFTHLQQALGSQNIANQQYASNSVFAQAMNQLPNPFRGPNG